MVLGTIGLRQLRTALLTAVFCVAVSVPKLTGAFQGGAKAGATAVRTSDEEITNTTEGSFSNKTQIQSLQKVDICSKRIFSRNFQAHYAAKTMFWLGFHTFGPRNLWTASFTAIINLERHGHSSSKPWKNNRGQSVSHVFSSFTPFPSHIWQKTKNMKQLE